MLNGAQAHARRIDADVGGTLYIESPQDTVEQESKQSGGGIRAQVALGTAWNVSGNYNQSKASGHSRSVGSQSGLFAGEGGYHITADGVRLKGGAIASAADKDHNELTARSFSFEDIRNESSYSASSMGIGAGYGGSLKGSDGFNQSAFGRASQTAGQNMNKGLNYSPTLPQHESGDSQGYTRSLLSEGNITIDGRQTSARALGIHTDSTTAHHGADSVPDLQNLLDKQQTIAQSTAAIHSAVGTYRGNRAKAAAEELEKQQAAYEGRLKEQHAPYLCVEQGIGVCAVSAVQAASGGTHHRSKRPGLRFDLFFNVLGQKVGIEFSAWEQKALPKPSLSSLANLTSKEQKVIRYLARDNGKIIVNGEQIPVNRLPQDINVKPTPPSPLNGSGRTIGKSKSQNQIMQDDVAYLRSMGAKDIRINQQQVNNQMCRVGICRPDVQATLRDSNKRIYIEYDRASSNRGAGHASRALSNDPDAIVILRTVD